MDDVLAKFCYESKQHFATVIDYAKTMAKTTARQALAANLRRLMRTTPALNTGKKIEQKTAGRVVQRTVSNMVRADKPHTNSPTLDNIEEVAKAYGLEAWQLLIDENSVREKVVNTLVPGFVPEHASELEIPSQSAKKRHKS